MSLATVLRAVANYFEPAIVAAPATSAPVVGAVTYGEVATVLAGFAGTGWADLSTAWNSRFKNLAADEAVTIDVLNAVALEWPPAALIALGVRVLPVIAAMNSAPLSGLNPTERNTADNHWPFSRGR